MNRRVFLVREQQTVSGEDGGILEKFHQAAGAGRGMGYRSRLGHLLEYHVLISTKHLSDQMTMLAAGKTLV